MPAGCSSATLVMATDCLRDRPRTSKQAVIECYLASYYVSGNFVPASRRNFHGGCNGDDPWSSILSDKRTSSPGPFVRAWPILIAGRARSRHEGKEEL